MRIRTKTQPTPKEGDGFDPYPHSARDNNKKEDDKEQITENNNKKNWGI